MRWHRDFGDKPTVEAIHPKRSCPKRPTPIRSEVHPAAHAGKLMLRLVRDFTSVKPYSRAATGLLIHMYYLRRSKAVEPSGGRIAVGTNVF
jgi:hypothetical protein